MTILTIGSIGAALLLVPAATSVEGVSRTINYRATATFSDGTSADRLYSINVGDLDGDGIADEGWLRVACADGAATAAYYHSVKSPRDAASGLATGKRMHRPFKIQVELDRKVGPAGKAVSWDLVQGKGSRVDHSRASDDSAGKGADRKTLAHDSWRMVKIKEGSPNLCD